MFRTGGDELLALCPGISKEALDEKVKALKSCMPRHDVIMAVGAVWQENGSMELDELLTEAERLMYADKEIYYKTSGAKRRKAR